MLSEVERAWWQGVEEGKRAYRDGLRVLRWKPSTERNVAARRLGFVRGWTHAAAQVSA